MSADSRLARRITGRRIAVGYIRLAGARLLSAPRPRVVAVIAAGEGPHAGSPIRSGRIHRFARATHCAATVHNGVDNLPVSVPVRCRDNRVFRGIGVCGAGCLGPSGVARIVRRRLAGCLLNGGRRP